MVIAIPTVLVIQGYDDATEVLISDDPLLGADHHITYEDFTEMSWPGRPFMIPVYPPEKDDLVVALMGEMRMHSVQHISNPSCKERE